MVNLFSHKTVIPTETQHLKLHVMPSFKTTNTPFSPFLKTLSSYSVKVKVQPKHLVIKDPFLGSQNLHFR